eukprot:Awhi_evm1s7480
MKKFMAPNRRKSNATNSNLQLNLYETDVAPPADFSDFSVVHLLDAQAQLQLLVKKDSQEAQTSSTTSTNISKKTRLGCRSKSWVADLNELNLDVEVFETATGDSNEFYQSDVCNDWEDEDFDVEGFFKKKLKRKFLVKDELLTSYRHVQISLAVALRLKILDHSTIRHIRELVSKYDSNVKVLSINVRAKYKDLISNFDDDFDDRSDYEYEDDTDEDDYDSLDKGHQDLINEMDLEQSALLETTLSKAMHYLDKKFSDLCLYNSHVSLYRNWWSNAWSTSSTDVLEALLLDMRSNVTAIPRPATRRSSLQMMKLNSRPHLFRSSPKKNALDSILYSPHNNYSFFPASPANCRSCDDSSSSDEDSESDSANASHGFGLMARVRRRRRLKTFFNSPLRTVGSKMTKYTSYGTRPSVP